MKLLFVVHRYIPYPGGSEYFVANMAEEALRRGHDVSVFTGEHKGDQNGVKVTSDPNELLQPYDLIIVHGGDVGLQNFVLTNAEKIPSPILFMIVAPSSSQVYMKALHDCKYLSWSTPQDYDYLTSFGMHQKMVNVRHGISELDTIGKNDFKAKLGISDKTMFLSCGGYWHNKKMKELVEVFKQANRPDAVLVMTGYDNRFGIIPDAEANIIPLMIDDKLEVMDAIASADCYLMHSDREGFGLVLLEAMLNNTPWIARNIAGATLMQDYGQTYETDEQLIELIQNFKRDEDQIAKAHDYVALNHLIKNTVDDIEKAILLISWEENWDNSGSPKILFAGTVKQAAPWGMHYELLEYNRGDNRYFQLTIRTGNNETIIDLPILVIEELAEAFAYYAKYAFEPKTL